MVTCIQPDLRSSIKYKLQVSTFLNIGICPAMRFDFNIKLKSSELAKLLAEVVFSMVVSFINVN